MQRRHQRLDEVSPGVGDLDEAALVAALEDDLDSTVPMLVDLARATDPELRRKVRRLAASVVIPAARAGSSGPTGGSARFGPVPRGGMDLDLDATVDRLCEKPTPGMQDLRWRGWQRPGRAVALVVDASGSVSGSPLSTAVVTAAALAARLGPADQLGVVAFWSLAVVLRHLQDPSPPSKVIERLLLLRGGDTTDLAGGIRAGLGELSAAATSRRDLILLTDGLANEGDDPVAVAASAARSGVPLHVMSLCPDGESVAACRNLADAGGGRVVTLGSLAEAPSAVASILR